MHKRIAQDLDGCAANFVGPFCKWLEEKTGIACPIDKVTSYYWYECFEGLSKETFWDEFHKFGNAGSYANLPVIDGAVDSLWALTRAGYDIVYVTARPQYAYEQTVEWLWKNNFPQQNSLIVTQDKKSKHVIEKSLDLVIDDSPSIAQDIKTNTTSRFFLMDSPYNKAIQDCDRIQRVSDWKHIREVLGV